MKIEIKKDGGYTHLYVDGEELHRVHSYELKESVGELPHLIVELAPETIQVDVDGEVKILSEKDLKMKEGYKDFVRFLFRGAVDAGKNRDE